MQFTERTPLEKGFAAIFDQKVRPPLTALEAERVKRLRTARLWFWGALAVAGGLIALLLLAGGGDWTIFAAFAVGILGVAAAFIGWSIQSSGWSGAVEGAVMPAVCEHVGDLTYSSSAGGGFPIGEMYQLGMLPRYDRSNLTDDMKGTYQGTAFELVEARLTKQTRDSDNKTKTTTVFRGLLFHIEVPVEVPTPILITRDYGVIGNTLGSLFSGKSGRGMPKVEFDHPEFESAFEVHAEDPLAARDFMPDAFLDSLLSIGRDEGRRGTKSMTAGFRNRSFYLALARGGDFMKMGSLKTPVADMEDDLHAIFADIELVHRIIDRLHGR